MMDLFSLDGKIAIVTGGTGYYGKPISHALGEAGAHVIIASRNVSRCRQEASLLVGKGWRAEGRELDLGNGDSVRAFVEDVYHDLGHIDVLVNNAVSREGFADLEDITEEGWRNEQKVNSEGLVLLTQAVIRIMRRQRHGNIINIGSIQGVVGPNFTVYGDTGMTSPLNYTYDKWALVGFTKWIANYYGKLNIRCNCISPGGFGPGVDNDYGQNEFVENYRRLTPLGRFADEDDIKGPVVFLASDASAYITGHNLIVDGGWTNW